MDLIILHIYQFTFIDSVLGKRKKTRRGESKSTKGERGETKGKRRKRKNRKGTKEKGKRIKRT